MNRPGLIAVLAALAGFGLGAISAQSQRPPAKAASALPAGEARVGRELIGAGEPSETALGNALNELRQAHSDLHGLARLGAALQLLNSEQIAKLLDRPAITDPWLSDDRNAWLFSWWMKRDPTAATAWLEPKLDAFAQDGPLGRSFANSANGQLVLAWAQEHPQAALDYARRHPRTGLAAQLLSKAIAAWPNQDDRQRLALLLAFPPGQARATALRELHESWAARDPVAACASATALDAGPERAKAIGAALIAWGQRDPAAAFAQYRALGLRDPALLAKVLAKSAAENPAQVLQWLTQLDAAQLARSAPRIVEAWAERDPAAALGWAFANGVSLTGGGSMSGETVHDGFGRSFSSTSDDYHPLRTAFTKQPEATLAWLRSLPPGPERDRVVENAISPCPDPEQALALAVTLPPEAALRTARELGSKFGDTDRGRQWAASLPPGPLRAQAWAGLGSNSLKFLEILPGPDRDAMISGAYFSDVEEQIAAIGQIGDPILRRDQIDETMDFQLNVWRNDADKARAALEKANIPEEWKRRWRKPAVPSP